MDTGALEAMMEMNRHNIPIMLSSGPILGSTAPGSLPAMVAQAHAEILACITLSQLIRPGAPAVYTSFARGMNMKTTNISMAGPEFAVLKVAMAQMGLALDLPVRMPAMLRDAMQLDTDMVVDFPDLLFCNDCMAVIRHALRPMDVNETTTAFDLIREVGPGGNFLAHRHTFENFKTELLHPELMDHDNWASWYKKGARTIRDKALIRVRGLLTEKADPLVTPEQARAIDAIVKEKADILCQAVGLIGSWQIRNAGTIGGNICNASPAGDSLPVLLALDAEFIAQGPEGDTTFQADRFFTGPGATRLAPDQILREIRFPTPMRVPEAEGLIQGLGLDAALDKTEACARACTEAARPIDDLRATAGYKRTIVNVFARRAARHVLTTLKNRRDRS